ncbi:50S ribosomal protein L17 [bacterium]|nr:50S ribosomal protein L17 [bacterium]
MRKRKKGRKLSRKRDQRKALLRSLANNLLLQGRIKTTEARAKEVSQIVQKYISKAKKMDLARRRFLLRYLPPQTVKKLEKEIAPRYAQRNGGYTRIIKAGPRKGDNAKMVIIELV